MTRERPAGRARRSRLVPLCASGALLLAATGCLNPLPDDFPNQSGDSASQPTGAMPGAPPQVENDGPSPSPSGGASQSPEAPAPEDPGSRDAGTGADADVDAGAPPAEPPGEVP